VKSGGHGYPGFSSTKGILIYTRNFSQVTYDAVAGTVVVGTGLIWDAVYERLEEHKVVVLGGRATGVGGRRNFLDRSFLNLCRVTDRRRRLVARRRLAPEGSPAFCTLTGRR